MKIASWNVNSLAVRLPAVLAWIEAHQPMVLALQETKMVNEKFPSTAIEALGYSALHLGQPTYNGVCLLSKRPLTEVQYGLSNYEDPQARFLAGTLDDIRIINVYVPNGASITSDKYRYKLEWLNYLMAEIKQTFLKYKKVVILGDFNIAPEDNDIYAPELFQDQVLASKPEREFFQDLLALGMVDIYRHHYPNETTYTWWDYRQMAFRRGWGLRIDHLLVSEPLLSQSIDCQVDLGPRKAERPSDHAPIYGLFKK